MQNNGLSHGAIIGYRIFERLIHTDRQHERRLANGFAAKHVVFPIRFGPKINFEMFGDVARCRDFVSAGGMGGEQALVVPHELLGGQPAHSLHKATFNLSGVDGGVDECAYVVKDVNFQDPVFARQRVNGYLCAGRAIGKVVKRPARERGFVVMNFWDAVKAV